MWLTHKAVNFIAGKDRALIRNTYNKNERTLHIQLSFLLFFSPLCFPISTISFDLRQDKVTLLAYLFYFYYATALTGLIHLTQVVQFQENSLFLWMLWSYIKCILLFSIRGTLILSRQKRNVPWHIVKKGYSSYQPFSLQSPWLCTLREFRMEKNRILALES